MILGKKMLFSLLLGLDLLTNVLELAHINFLSTTTIISFGTYLILPGFLISLILRIRKISFWENLIIIVGLSIAFLEFGGLLLNILLPLIGIKDPLAFQNTVFGFDIYLLLLFVFAWLRTKQLVIEIPRQSHPVARSSPTMPFTPSQPARPGITPISEQPYLISESDPTMPPRSSQFLRPGITPLPEQSHLISESGPTTPPGPSQFLRPGFIKARSTVPKNTDVKPSLIDTQDRAMANIDTIASIPIPLPKRSNIEKVLYILPIFFPILAVLGTIVLNNGGSNILTLILLGSVACYSFLLVLFRDKIRVNLYPYALFFITVACLLTTSLRSWYITGHDIELEFYVFQQTKIHHLWNIAFYQDPYNACLSITILPTILTHLLSIQDMYVYKVIYQILFATVPVLIFFLMKNYTTLVLAFLSAFILISCPTFLIEMPMLNRQEIGFIFFGLVLYMLLLSDIPLAMRRSLFVLFALSVIVSHYSTNFVLLVLLAFVYMFTLIISLPFVKKALVLLSLKSHIKPNITIPHKAFLNPLLVAILFLMTFFWNTVYTKTSNHSESVVTYVISSIFLQSRNESSTDITYNIFSPRRKPNPDQLLREYIQQTIQSSRAKGTESDQFYSASITSKYPTHLVPEEQFALTPLGNWLASFPIPVLTVQEQLSRFFNDFLHAFVFIGVLAIFFFKQKKKFNLSYLLLCFGSIVLLALIIVVPSLGVYYGELRMLEQLLFIVSLPVILVLCSLLFFAKEQKRILFTGIAVMFLFLNTTGFISHLTGVYEAYDPTINLDNAGASYDTYYVHKSDVLAIMWISNNNVNQESVQTDYKNMQKLLTYGGVNTTDEIFPPEIQKNAYVYLASSDRLGITIGADLLFYNSPKPFLDDNKNHIYSNGKGNIYK